MILYTLLICIAVQTACGSGEPLPRARLPLLSPAVHLAMKREAGPVLREEVAQESGYVFKRTILENSCWLGRGGLFPVLVLRSRPAGRVGACAASFTQPHSHTQSV